MVQNFAELQSRDPGPWQEKLTLTCASRKTDVALLKA